MDRALKSLYSICPIRNLRFFLRKPLSGAFLLAFIMSIILIPYWWLAVKWSESIFSSPSVQFAFTVTTFLLVLIIIDIFFILRYYQIVKNIDISIKTEELKRSEDKYRTLFEIAPFPVVISRLSDNRLRLINHRTAEIFDVNVSEVIGKKVDDYYENIGERKKVLDLIQRNGFLSDFEVELRSTKGRKIWASLSANKITYLGEPALFIAFADITRRKELEETLKKSEEIYRSVVTASPDAIVNSDLTGIISMVSPAAVSMFGGNSDSDFLGRSVLDFIHPGDADRAHRNMIVLLTGGELQPQQYRGKRIDGTFFPYEIHSELTYDLTSEPSGYVYVIRDITKRIEAEQAIREYQERFITIFEEIPDPLLILDDSGRILDINRIGEENLLLNKENILGLNLDNAGLFGSNSEEDPIRFILDKESKESLETIIILPNGMKKYVILSTRRFMIRNSHGILLLIHDIDDIRRTQNALAQANNQLNLLNNITRHDILNRVMVVTGYSEYIREYITEKPYSTKIDIIFESGRDIQHLIEFTREYQDLGVRQPFWQQLNKIVKIHSIQSLLNNLTLNIPDTHIEIFADPMLEKVIYNLIENSVRHGEGVTTITISYEEQGSDLKIVYSDDGIGISENEKELIFKKGHGKNTGLGLFLIREILKITSITIHENGIPGDGVRFEMIIPAGSFRLLS